jgi:flagellar export protein FliJ
MTPFRFPLERVLDWRKLQLRAEEEKLAAAQQKLEMVTQRLSALAAAELKSEMGLRKLPTVDGSELQTVAAFQARIRKMNHALELEKQQCEKQIVAQRTRLLKARKDFRILEKLRERRHEAWVYLTEREIESIAADSYNSKLARAKSEAADEAEI